VQRNEKDQVSILSGVERSVTLGTPIGMTVPNEDMRPEDYAGVVSLQQRLLLLQDLTAECRAEQRSKTVSRGLHV
jgi:hypothetical protein